MFVQCTDPRAPCLILQKHNIWELLQRVSEGHWIGKKEKNSRNIAKNSFVWQKKEHHIVLKHKQKNDWYISTISKKKWWNISTIGLLFRPLRMFVHNIAEPLQPLFLARSLLGRQSPLMNVNHGTRTSEHCGVFRLQHWELRIYRSADTCAAGGTAVGGRLCMWKPYVWIYLPVTKKLNIPGGCTSVSPYPFTLLSLLPLPVMAPTSPLFSPPPPPGIHSNGLSSLDNLSV